MYQLHVYLLISLLLFSDSYTYFLILNMIWVSCERNWDDAEKREYFPSSNLLEARLAWLLWWCWFCPFIFFIAFHMTFHVGLLEIFFIFLIPLLPEPTNLNFSNRTLISLDWISFLFFFMLPSQRNWIEFLRAASLLCRVQCEFGKELVALCCWFIQWSENHRR